VLASTRNNLKLVPMALWWVGSIALGALSFGAIHGIGESAVYLTRAVAWPLLIWEDNRAWGPGLFALAIQLGYSQVLRLIVTAIWSVLIDSLGSVSQIWKISPMVIGGSFVLYIYQNSRMGGTYYPLPDLGATAALIVAAWICLNLLSRKSVDRH
jgi:hypothetical protein